MRKFRELQLVRKNNFNNNRIQKRKLGKVQYVLRSQRVLSRAKLKRYNEFYERLRIKTV